MVDGAAHLLFQVGARVELRARPAEHCRPFGERQLAMMLAVNLHPRFVGRRFGINHQAVEVEDDAFDYRTIL
jgi:hypothetical protein